MIPPPRSPVSTLPDGRHAPSPGRQVRPPPATPAHIAPDNTGLQQTQSSVSQLSVRVTAGVSPSEGPTALAAAVADEGSLAGPGRKSVIVLNRSDFDVDDRAGTPRSGVQVASEGGQRKSSPPEWVNIPARPLSAPTAVVMPVDSLQRTGPMTPASWADLKSPTRSLPHQDTTTTSGAVQTSLLSPGPRKYPRSTSSPLVSPTGRHFVLN
jgi:hypothetical protein